MYVYLHASTPMAGFGHTHLDIWQERCLLLSLVGQAQLAVRANDGIVTDNKIVFYVMCYVSLKDMATTHTLFVMVVGVIVSELEIRLPTPHL